VVHDTLQDIDELIKTFNALLSIAQIEAGVQRDRDDWTNVDLSNLVDDLGDLYSAVAEEKQQTFHFQTEPNLVTFGNRQLIAQALTNLLDNAMKYTPAGGQIDLSARRQADKIQIEVSDSGPGIPSAAYTQVFKRFTRLDNARSSPGNGLGLSLVKAILDLHETKIELNDNQPGLKITLFFPVSPAH
jgi:signal transduction histidine kinase